MSGVTIEQFNDYFRELHGYDPYSWQQNLAERAAEGNWPDAIDLPTGSGKTACIDIAVFALACQASRAARERSAPRRVFFCVNRRVVVDEAYERAKRIAKTILEAQRRGADDKPVLCCVAAALRAVGGTTTDKDTPPLDVLELRGGIYRDNRWARSATQPTIICTTIDQLGSRLLFRGYGVSSGAAPIQAALIAYDSLILLDEAHISNPFLQTLAYVRRYLDPEKWAEQAIDVTPVVVAPMTATPSKGPSTDDKPADVLGLTGEDRKNESLKQRLTAHKPAELREVKDKKKNVASAAIEAAVEAATELAKDKPTAVGIIVNRVATAKDIYKQLRKNNPDAIVELVIGSMRPINRDEQAKRLRDLIGPCRPVITAKTSFVVATQCLEVGADYDFDALVTECASLDALRQRFGRLNRAGRSIVTKAVIVAEQSNIKPDDKIDNEKPLDPIYGNALARTWNWLTEHATDETVEGKTTKRIDFGIDAFKALLKKHSQDDRIPDGLLAPSASHNAPVMLPAYVDFWCQTSPRPVPDPDVSLFIHGPQGGEPDVQVCWRADLVEDGVMKPDKHWCDVVALLPPTAAECMSVPISRVRRWLTQSSTAEDDGDLLGVAESNGDDGKKGKTGKNNRREHTLKHFGVLWRGLKESDLLDSPNDLHPGDTLVLPVTAGGWDKLGHIPPPEPTGLSTNNHPPANDEKNPALNDSDKTGDNPESNAESHHVDKGIAEIAFQTARDRAALRLHPSLRDHLPPGRKIDPLFDRAADRDDPPTVYEWRDLLQTAANAMTDGTSPLKQSLSYLTHAHLGLLCEPYPDRRGVVLTTRRRLGTRDSLFVPTLDDGEDEPSRSHRDQPVLLTDHTQHVVKAVQSAVECLSIHNTADIFRIAAQLHDLGKADIRFQAMLRRTDRTDAWLLGGLAPVLWAKSDGLPLTYLERDAARRRAGLPSGFRHEMLSVQLAEQSTQLPTEAADRDLVLHLLAAHHGRARPFAPVVPDDEWPAVTVDGVQLSHEERKSLVPPHRLDSGIAERFWRLTRRFGWWGLAYLEAVLRLADQQASAAEDAGQYDNANAQQPAEATA